MSSHGLLPKAAPFQDDDRASLDRVLSGATAIQRAWLAGFLAGLDVAERPSAQAAASLQTVEPLAILYASESGNAERLAGDVAKLARKQGFKPKLIDFADLTLASLATEKQAVVIASTWGEGEPPARSARAYRDLMAATAPRLEGLRFGVLALGDTAYAEFCAIGRKIDERLAELGGSRVVARVDCDLDFETPASAWINDALHQLAPARDPGNVVAVDFKARGSVEPGSDVTVAVVSEHINLNSSRSEKETIHLALSFDGASIAFEPGDSLDVYPQNDPELVEQVLAETGLAADGQMRAALTAERDITTLSLATLEKLGTATQHAGLRALLEGGNPRAWIQGRQLIDALEAFPARLTPEQLTQVTRPLPPRAYSIASSLKEYPGEAHLLVSAVRYESHGRARRGVASTYIADRLHIDDKVRVRVKPNRHFRLTDPSADIIMVGPGTGVAPFRAFVQERKATGAAGRNWLFFGDRRFTHDFLYQLEWLDALNEGALTRLDLAFSRDQPEKIYVQQRLRERRRELVDWIEGGASFYVCGDGTAMAKDVRAALVQAFADVKALSPDAAEATVAELERGKRYLQDVY